MARRKCRLKFDTNSMLKIFVISFSFDDKKKPNFPGAAFQIFQMNYKTFCDIVEALSINLAASIDDEFWLGASRVQVHAGLLNLNKEEFLAQYPVGRKFRMEFTVRVMEEQPFTVGSPQISVN